MKKRLGAMKHKGKFISVRKQNRLENLKRKENTSVNDGKKEQKGTDEQKDKNDSWAEGRRIVELSVLAQGLKECVFCKENLRLDACVDETKYGLASILYVKCVKCNNLNSVPTGKRHTTNVDGKGPPRCFDVNTKLAAAMLHAGIGEQQVNNILAELNLPSIHHKTLKEREREIGCVMEDIAENSCNAAIQAEIICSNSGDAPDLSCSEGAEVSCDGGWQKRGTGRNYNSLSGHVTVVGKSTKKCLSYGVACKSCRKCQYRKRGRGLCKSHSCRKNWSGSAKGMEPFLTVKCIKSLKEKGLDVRKLIMDDDSTTFLRTKKAVPNITKSSDKNHVVRNLSNALYKVKETHGGLSVKTIKYFKKCFAYTIQQNKNDVEGIRKNLYATVPHAFGDHSQCNSSWCGFLKDPSTYKHKSLPSGKDLVGEKLREALQDVFQKHAEKAEKYTDLGSSNANENLNQMIAKKAPKAQHYSGSESLSYRVAAAVAQKNEGHKYILQVNSACNLSPGKQTEKRQNLLDKKRSTKHHFQGTYKAKIERLRLREQRQTSETTMELCEGTTYATDIELSATNDELEDLITEIPMSERKPKISPLSSETSNIIVADLETTGLATDSSIIQIAASSYCTEDTFSSFIRPQNGYIPKTVSKLTGIEVHGLTMFSDMVPVRSMGEKEALLKFVEWMKKYDPVLIVAHNACFDSRILISAFNRHGIADHLKSIVGFSDSIKIFKKAFPSQSSYKLQHLVQQFGTDLPPVQAHNAVNDVLVLRHMLLKISGASDSLRQSAFSVEHVTLQIKKAQNKQKHLDGYDQLISQNVLTKTQCSSLASHGLSVKHVQLTFNRAGVDGLKDVLKGKIKKISIAAEKLARHFSQATS